MLVPSLLMVALGAADDIWHVRPVSKLVGQMLVASVLVYIAPPVTLTGLAVLDQLLVFAWIVGITNAFNLLDNIDGLAAGVAAIAGTFLLLILVPDGQSPMIPAIAAFVGATLGFLLYNFQPASIFMGDAGSFLLGSFLASATLLALPEPGPDLAPVAAIPLLLLLVPIFDTAFVMLTRRIQGRRVWIGGRDHTSHRLVALGIADRRAVLTLYALAGLGGLVAFALRHLSFGYVAVMLTLYLVLVIGLGVLLGHVEVSRGPDAAPSRPQRRLLVSDLTYRYRIYEVMLDTVLVGLAYYASLRLRFQEPEFSTFFPYFLASFPLVVASQLAALWWAGKYSQTWSTFGSTELLSIRAHSRFPGHALTPTGVMAIRCKQFHLPDL